jgi:hypothetical protein
VDATTREEGMAKNSQDIRHHVINKMHTMRKGGKVEDDSKFSRLSN